MSDVIISEGGVSRKFAPVNKLKVNNQESGVSLWTSDKEVGSVNITNNGVYAAVEDEYYVYDEVTVDVPEDLDDPTQTGSITGHDPVDGNDYEYELNENGELDVSMIPAAIHIVVPPRKLKYEEGETIDFSGIHVYLMDGNNRRYVDDSYPTGEIPFDELMFPVTIASGSQGGSASSDLDTEPLTQPIPFGSSVFITGESDNGFLLELEFYGGSAAIAYGGSDYEVLIASSTDGIVSYNEKQTRIIDGRTITDRTIAFNMNGSKTINGKTVHYYDGSGAILSSHNIEITPLVDASFHNSQNIGEIAWTLIYGDISGGNEIPVQWMRSDGEILEDTFEIEVGEGGEPGPPEPDPWAGNYDVSWHGHTYNINRKIVPEVHYANGYCWQEGTTEYTVEQAVGFGWLIRIGM